MKHYFLLALAIIALMLSGCKNENKTDPKYTDNGERDYIVRMYVSQDLMDYFDYGVYVTLPNQQETKLAFDNKVAPDATLDEQVLEQINDAKMDASYLQVYAYNTKGEKGQAKVRLTLALKAGVELPDKLNLIEGFLLSVTVGDDIYEGGDCSINGGFPKEGVQDFIGFVDGTETTINVK